MLVLLELSDEVLKDVTLTECLRQFHPESWTVHEINGHWFGELEDEPLNVPVPTLGWTMWHPVWWLETLLSVSRGEDAPSVSEVEWPGPATTIARIRELWSEWTSFVGGLTDDDLRSGQLTRFPYTDGRVRALAARRMLTEWSRCRQSRTAEGSTSARSVVSYE